MPPKSSPIPVTAATSLTRVAEARVPLEDAPEARIVAFRAADGGIEHLAILVGTPEATAADGGAPLVRVHSECFTGDLLGSLRCDCGPQLRGAIARMGKDPAGGVLLYLAQEGRGIGLVNKLRAYTLQDAGLDTLDANRALGYGADERNFLVAATMLRAIGVERVRLLTNNPDKVAGLTACGIEVLGREAHVFDPNGVNDGYLEPRRRASATCCRNDRHRAASPPTACCASRARRCAAPWAQRGIRAIKQEGDGATPAGLLPIRRLLFRADRGARPATALPGRADGTRRRLVRRPGHRDYNTAIRLPHAGRHEAALARGCALRFGRRARLERRAGRSAAAAARFSCTSPGPDLAPTEGCIALPDTGAAQIARGGDDGHRGHRLSDAHRRSEGAARAGPSIGRGLECIVGHQAPSLAVHPMRPALTVRCPGPPAAPCAREH